MHAKYPKILPWVAKKAGVPLTRAEALWDNAVRYATQQASVVESSEYWKLALQHLFDSIENESCERRATPFGFGPLVRLPARLLIQGMTAQQAIIGAAANAAFWWQRRAC